MKATLFLYLSAMLMVIFVFSCKKDDENTVLKACFSYNITEMVGGEVQFKNCSENATSYLWDFGDGKFSNDKEPKHLFDGNLSLIHI